MESTIGKENQTENMEVDIPNSETNTSNNTNISNPPASSITTNSNETKEATEKESNGDTQNANMEAEQDPVKQKFAQLRAEIATWIKENGYVNMYFVGLQEDQFQAMFTIDAIPFQILLNENFHPWLITSEVAEIGESIAPINFELEEANQTDKQMSISNLLNILALAYKEQERNHPRPTLPHRVNFPNVTPAVPQKPTVEPTPQDFDDTIIPEIRKALLKDNFLPYEIDEWVRRVQVQLKRGDLKKAMEIVRDDIFGGSVPEEIVHFVPRRRFFGGYGNDDESSGYDPPAEQDRRFIDVGGSKEAVERLKMELLQLKEINTKELGFSATPSGNDLFHWHLKLFGFGNETTLGLSLTEWAIKHTTISDSTASIEQDILIEMKFPLNFPHAPPMFRIIRPRFENIDVDIVLPSKSPLTTTTTSTTSNANSSPSGRKSLTVSRAIEKSKDNWVPSTAIIDYIQQIRSFIIDIGAKVDLECGLEGYSLPTIGNFWRSFTAISPNRFGRPEIEDGGKIILPTSALEDLSQELDKFSHPFFGGIRQSFSGSFQSGTSPILFEISTEKGKRCFCGVEEFTAEEGFMVVPQWILNNIGSFENSPVQLRRVNLPKGTYIKLQPHTADFLEVNDTKAMFEWVLPKYVAMSVGDTIVINYRNKKYSFNVLEVKPGRAVQLIDSDVTTEFAPPLSGEQVAYSKPQQLEEDKTKDEKPQSPTTTTTTTTSTGTTTGALEANANQVEGVDYKTCDNCWRKIPLGVFNNHTLACIRMNWFCQTCQLPVEKSKKEDHMKEFHTIVYCECGASLENRLLASHKANECPKRIVTCSYCPLQMPYIERYEHEQRCGSQTEKCETCNRYIQKRDMPVHMVECATQRQQAQSFTPPPSSPYRFPSQTLPGPREDVLVCPVCSVPYMHLDDLQVHMITEHPESMETSEKKPEESQPEEKAKKEEPVETQQPVENNAQSTSDPMDQEKLG